MEQWKSFETYSSYRFFELYTFLSSPNAASIYNYFLHRLDMVGHAREYEWVSIINLTTRVILEHPVFWQDGVTFKRLSMKHIQFEMQMKKYLRVPKVIVEGYTAFDYLHKVS